MLHDHATNWMGFPVELFDPAKGASDYETKLYRLATDWEQEVPILEIVSKWLAPAEVSKAPGVVIGLYAPEMEGDSSEIVQALVAARDKLTSLRGIFMNDIIGEEQEISWIENSDMSALFNAFPQLEHFRVRGGNNLRLGAISSEKLQSLVVETGGLDRNILEGLVVSELPNLEHLELWFGEDNYGLTCTIDDIKPLLEPGRFPSLKRLGLRNCDYQDEIAELVAQSPMIAGLEVLDLSLGTLKDKGGEALLASPHLGGLKQLDLHHHFMSVELMQRFKSLDLEVNVSEKQDAEEDGDDTWYYVAVSE